MFNEIEIEEYISRFQGYALHFVWYRVYPVAYGKWHDTIITLISYVYKKPRLIPGKANAEQQKDFVECFNAEIKKNAR